MDEWEQNVYGHLKKDQTPQRLSGRRITTWAQIKPLIDASATHGIITRENVIESDWNYFQFKFMRDAPDIRPYNLKRKTALKKAKAAVPGSLTVEEARIVCHVRQTNKEKNKKQLERYGNATYRHSSIVQSLNSQLDASKQKVATLNKELKALKADIEELRADNT